MELIDQLTKTLGINEAQATGGVGLIFKQAKEKLGSADFAKISTVIPGIDRLISAAPTTGEGVFGDLGKVMSGLGGPAGDLGSIAGLASGFSKLGLDKGMIGKFIPIILSFVQGKGGDATRSILEKVIK